MELLKKFQGICKIAEFNDKLYIIYQKKDEYKISTLVKKDDLKYVYPNLWFSSWEEFNENLYLVCKKNGNCTLIKKEDGTFFLGEKVWLPKLNFKKLNDGRFYVITKEGISLYK